MTFLSLSMSVFLIHGCSGESNDEELSPGETVLTYVKAKDDRQVSTYYPLLCADDRLARKAEFFSSVPTDSRFFQALMERTTYEIGNEEIDGESATVVLRITSPNAMERYAELMPADIAIISWVQVSEIET